MLAPGEILSDRPASRLESPRLPVDSALGCTRHSSRVPISELLTRSASSMEQRYDLPMRRPVRLLASVHPGNTARVGHRRTVLQVRVRACLMVSTTIAALGCRRVGSDASSFSGRECFRVQAAGPMSSRDSTNISRLYRHVRMDSTHVRWNEIAPGPSEMRYLYLDSTVESWGYRSNYWAKDARSDSLHWWAGNGFSGITLVLTPSDSMLVGYATVGGDAPGSHPRHMGQVRAEPVDCGPLLRRRPPNPDSGWSRAEDTTRPVGKSSQ